MAAAKCYAAQAHIQGHWDEELHGLDYLVYAYLQEGKNGLAAEQVKYLDTINAVYPANFKVAYAFAAIPARYCLENKDWAAAASVQLHPAGFPWANFPWQESIVHFCRLLGKVHTGRLADAGKELAILQELKEKLEKQKDVYKSGQVAIQIKAGEAWTRLAAGKKAEALQLMQLSAAMEDSTEKHPVTPGSVLPARELLGDMYLQLQQYDNALQAYEAVLQKCPQRFNSLYGCGLAAAKSGNRQKALVHLRQLLSMADTVHATRPELAIARKIVAAS